LNDKQGKEGTEKAKKRL